MQHKLIPEEPINHPRSVLLSETQHREIKSLPRVKIDIRKTEYPLLFSVSTNSLGWRIWSVKKQSKDDRDVIWNDHYVTEKDVKKLNYYQRINHFPGSEELGKKNLLAMNLERLKNTFCESFFPQTWILPRDNNKFKRLLNSQVHQQYYIAKPEALSQGKGIFLFNSLDQLPYDWETSSLVIQKYIHKPFLIDGLKFDFRIYVLLRSLSPLKIYVYKEGLTRFATSKYEHPSSTNQTNVMMHLTNYAINKRNPQFVFSTTDKDDNTGHKRSFRSVIQLLKSMGINTISLEHQIDFVIVKTILACLENLIQNYKRAREGKQITSVCFQILGFDIMIDENLTPFVIEVNHSPSFATDSHLDYNIKKNLILDTLNLIRVDREGKKEFLSGGKNGTLQKIIMEFQSKQLQAQEQEYQQKNMGSYRRVFPTKSVELNYIYQQIIGSKSMKLYRINFQTVNKGKISEIQSNKKYRNKSQTGSRSKKYFPAIPDISSTKTTNCFSIQEVEEFESEHYKKYNFNDSLAKNAISDISFISAAAFSHNEFLNKKMLRQSHQLQILKLKNLEIDFHAPSKKDKYPKGSMIHSTVKSYKDYQMKPGWNSPNKHKIHWTTRSMMMNYQKNKRENDEDINLKLDGVVIKETRVETEQDAEDDKYQSRTSPIKVSTLGYDPNIKRPIRIRERSFIKPVLGRNLNEDKRRFSIDQKKLVAGFE